MSLCTKHLQKNESDLKQYAKLASEGMMLAYPVKVNGKDRRPDIDNIYHSTIKLFDTAKDHPHQAHEVAQHLPLNPPDARDIEIEPVTLTGRTGYKMHALKLKGPHTQKMQEHNGKFAGMGFPQNQVFEPHITVDKDLWDHVTKNNIKNAHEAGIEFGHAQLRKGPKVLKTYQHSKDSNEPKVPELDDYTAKIPAPTTKSENVVGEKPLMKPYVSEAQRRWAHTASGKEALGGNAGVHEWDEATKGKKLPERVSKSDDLQKGALKNIGAAIGMAGALAAGGAHAEAKSHTPKHPSVQVPSVRAPSYDHSKMLRTIAQVESSGGKNTNHPPSSTGETAFGKYGLMPNTITDTIKGHKDLKAKYGKALALKGPELQRYMQDNKGLEDTIADRHLSHMEHVLGQNPDHIGYAWLNGVNGALKAKKNNEDIKNHWHVKKIRDAYGKEK